MAIQKPNSSASSAGGSSDACQGMLVDLTPTLFEYLSSERYDDGSKRQTSTFTVFVEDGTVKLCLNDREEGRTAWVTGDSLEAVLSSMEERLRMGRIEWKKSSWSKGKGKKN